MDYFVWQRTCVDESGNVLPSASVTVTDVVSGALATLYSDEGSTGAGNPITADSNGFVQFYVKAGVYDIEATLDGNTREWNDEAIGAPYKRTAAEVSATVTPTNYQLPELYVERYNSGDDRVAITRALAVALARGDGVIHFEPGKDYDLGNSGSSENIFTASGLSNVTINGNGARLVANSTGNYQPVIFNLENPSGLTINDLRGIDDGADLSVDFRGAWLFHFWGSGASAKRGNIKINNCHGEDLVAFMVCSPAEDARIENIAIDATCSIKNCYYGIACQNNGDDITGVLNCWNPRRAYIGYGNKNVDLTLNVYIDSDSVVASSIALIKCYDSDYPTRGIKIKLNVSGDLTDYTTYNAFGFEHDTATGDDGLIECCDAELNLIGVTAGTVRPFEFTAYSNSVQETSTTDSVWRHIRLSGDIEQYAIATKANHVPIHLTVAPTVEADIVLAGSLVKALAPITFKNNFVFITDANSESRFYNGDLTAATIVIPLAGFDTLGFTLKVKVWAHDDYTDVAMTNFTYTERLITGTNAGAGNVSIVQADSLVAVDNGTASTITIAASGENLNVTFNNYNGANAQARVDVEYVMPMRNRL